MRLSSIRLHLGVALGLAAVQVGLLVGSGSRAPFAVASGLVTALLLALIGRAFALHRDRRSRILGILHAVQKAAAGENDVRLPVNEDDEAGLVADAVNELVATVRERTLQAQAEHDLDRRMVRETPNGLLIMDKHRVVRRANPALMRILELAKDPVGLPLVDGVPVQALHEAIDEAVRTQLVCQRAIAYQGRELLLRAVPSEEGGVLAAVLDVSFVGSAERVRREFVSNVSHELRAPITTIVGYAEALEEERARMPEDLRPMLDAIARNSERLRLLVEDVLHLARLESRRADLPLTPAPVYPLVRGTVERFAAVAAKREVRVCLAESVVADAPVNADALDHALGNLIDNAIKYSPAGGTVTVELAELAEAIEVSVTDQGPGIDPVHHPRIFERFYRVDPGAQRAPQGTGLGLSLVKHLCAAMHAEVRLVSAPGEGSRFVLRLPRANPA